MSYIMETIYQKQQRALIKKWLNPLDAQRIAYFKQRDLWRLDNWTYKVNEDWAWYSSLTSVERALLRRARREKRQPGEYKIENWKVLLRYKKNGSL